MEPPASNSPHLMRSARQLAAAPFHIGGHGIPENQVIVAVETLFQALLRRQSPTIRERNAMRYKFFTFWVSSMLLTGCQSPPPRSGATAVPISSPTNRPGASVTPDGRWVVSLWDSKEASFEDLWEIKGGTITCHSLQGDELLETGKIEPDGDQFVLKGLNLGDPPADMHFALTSPYEAVVGVDIVKSPDLYAHRIGEVPANLIGEWEGMNGRGMRMDKSLVHIVAKAQSFDPLYYLPCDPPTFMLIPTQPYVVGPMLGRVHEDGTVTLTERLGTPGVCLFRKGQQPTWASEVNYYQPLEWAGNNHTAVEMADTDPAYLQYCRRFRTGFSFGSMEMCKQNANLIERFKKGKYAAHPELFDSESGEFVDALLDSVQQFDRQVVPLVMDSAHRKISKTHGLCYQSMVALNEAKAQKGEQQRARHLKESEKWCKEALQTREAGFKEFWRNSKGEPRH